MTDSDFDDFGDTPRTPQRQLLERDVQGAAIRWVRGRGWWARKFSSPANRSVMDYIIGKDTWVELVEFKKPRGKLTEAQGEEHKAARACGMTPVVFDDLEAFKKYILDAEMWIRDPRWQEWWVARRKSLAQGHEQGDDITC